MSAFADSFALNSVDYGGTSYKVHIVSPARPWIPKLRVHLHSLAQADGAVSQGSKVGPRIWNLRCMIAAASASERATLVANVAAALLAAHQAGETNFVLGEEPTKQWQARPLDISELEIALTGGEFTLQIVAPDPDHTTI